MSRSGSMYFLSRYKNKKNYVLKILTESPPTNLTKLKTRKTHEITFFNCRKYVCLTITGKSQQKLVAVFIQVKKYLVHRLFKILLLTKHFRWGRHPRPIPRRRWSRRWYLWTWINSIRRSRRVTRQKAEHKLGFSWTSAQLFGFIHRLYAIKVGGTMD